jgi:hypothetical protein
VKWSRLVSDTAGDYILGTKSVPPMRTKIRIRRLLSPKGAPTIFIQHTRQPLVGATRYEQAVLRCSACLERFTAPMPAGVSGKEAALLSPPPLRTARESFNSNRSSLSDALLGTRFRYRQTLAVNLLVTNRM